MTYQILTNYSPCCIVIKVTTQQPQPIRIVAEDAEMQNTQYTNRLSTVMGQDTFYVNIPVCGQRTLLHIYNDYYGENNNVKDNSFSCTTNDISFMPLTTTLNRIDFSNPYVESFIEFATRFSFNAGVLQPGVYESKDHIFEIVYEDQLFDVEGNLSQTPARIEINTGVIELSREKYIPFTIPNRMAILLHEFSHIFVNDNMDDEVEADLNALNIYLSLGYPRIEAYEVFTATFYDTPTEENKERFDFVKNFIDEFDGNY